MGLSLRWVTDSEIDRVAETRALCYGSGSKDIDYFKERIRLDKRGKSGDWLLAERDGLAVGTTTSLSFNMWARGKRVACQGIAYVGTIKTHRRGGKGTDKGIASQLMCEALAKARERQEVVSALMPFRGSYYEHFGFGMIERRNEWTIPLSILPSGDFDGFRFFKPEDLTLIQACHQRAVERGQCDLERSQAGWNFFSAQWSNGFCVLDQPKAGGPVSSWMYFMDEIQDGRTNLRCIDGAYESPRALVRKLHFLASLRDQYSAAIVQLAPDVPLHWVLKETQLPHRTVEHAVARLATLNRLQVRVLDHAKFLDGQKLPVDTSGKTTVGVREIEGHTSVVAIELEKGHVHAKPASGSADVEVADKVWAAIACGDVSATTMSALGLVTVKNPSGLKVLDAFSHGPPPFCNERF